MSKKIVILKFRSFSHVNHRIRNVLESRFPQNEVVEIDVWRMIVDDRLLYIRILFWGFFKYFHLIVKGHQDLIDASLHTPLALRTIKKRLQYLFHDEDLLFSFQTQSFFDGSISGVPHFIYTDHTHLVNFTVPQWNSNKFWGKQWVTMEKSIYNAAIKVYTWSEHVRQSVINDYGIPAARVVKVGVGSNIDGNVNLGCNVVRYQNRIIIFVGVAWERKGGPELFEAFKLVSKKFPDTRLRIIGCSPKISYTNVEIIGRVSIEQVRTEMLNASIFCLPSRSEPFGIAVTEAMHFALPTITSNIEAMPEIVVENETGYLVPPCDPAALAGALERLLISPELCKKMGEAGRKRACELFTWERVGESIEKYTRSVLMQ